jgi:hypothetical protein
MQEFICPNGKMSVNGVCPMFENDVSQQIETFENNPFKQPFKFDFEKGTESKNDNANNIISKNINYYNNFVEDKLGIPSNVQSALRIGSSAYSALTGGSLMSVAAPFAIPFMIGGALRGKEENRVRDITMRDPQGDIQTTPARIMNIQPTPQDIYRGGGVDRPSPSPARTSQGVTSAQHQAFRS